MVSYYYLMTFIGAIVGGLLVYFHMREEGLSIKTQVAIQLALLASVFIGLFTAYSVNWLLHLPLSLSIGLGDAGSTWYPGLLAGIAFFALAVKLIKLDVSMVFNIAAPAYPLFHAFGRLGCAVSGCCYGMPIDAQIGSVHIDRVPTQLIEAVFLFGLFLLLEFAVKRHRMAIYLLAYAAGRFVIEFFRGDDRGQVFAGSSLSPAQWIALWSAAAVLCVLAVWRVRKQHSKAHDRMEELT